MTPTTMTMTMTTPTTNPSRDPIKSRPRARPSWIPKAKRQRHNFDQLSPAEASRVIVRYFDAGRSLALMGGIDRDGDGDHDGE